MCKFNELKNMDCLDYAATILDKSVDLILTDPPYEISRKTGFENMVNGVPRFRVSMDFGKWDAPGEVELMSLITEFHRILKNGGTAIIFYDLWKITTLKKMMEDAGFRQIRFIEWVKKNPVPLNSKVNYLTNSREIALCGVKGSKPTFNSEYDNGIYSYPIYHAKDRFHPTQKPVDLMCELIKKHSNAGDIVIDPFLGSGTTFVAAYKTDRICKGCELDIEMYNKMIDRVNDICCQK